MSKADTSDVVRIRSRVQMDMERYRRKREEVLRPEEGKHWNTLMVLLLLAVSAAIMYTWYEALVLWIIVTFILYSFNYIVFFLPITRHSGREREKRPIIPRRPISRPIRYLLTKRRRFTIEALTTMFLVGLVPLARSFFVLFGAGLVFTLYHGVILDELPVQLTAGLIVQILVIMGYLVLVVLVSPQSQGFTDIARNIKSRIITARSRSRSAYAWSVSAAGLLVLAISLMAVGAILLPGRTLDSLIVFLKGNEVLHIVASVAILVAEFFVMRVMQSRGSQTMALTLIDQKLYALRTICAAPLDAIIAEANARGETMVDNARFENVLYTYYPLAIYDVVETNLFGRLPVYLVVPDIDLVLDLEALKYISLRHRGDRVPSREEGGGTQQKV